MKKIYRSAIYIVIGLFLITLPFGALALENQSQQAISIASDQIIEGNFIKFGNVIDIAGSVNGDVIIAANSINISGSVAGDIFAVGNIIKISGPVGGNVRVMAGSVEINSQVERNVWAIGSTVNLNEASKVGWDLYAAAGSIDIKGSVGRNVWAGTATIIISSEVGNDLNATVDKEGQIILNESAKINGNLNYKAAQESQLVKKEGALVLGQTTLKGIDDILVSASDKINKALAVTYLFFKLISLFSLLVIGIVIITLMPKLAIRINEQMLKKPLSSFGLGLVYFLLMPLVVLLLFFTVIGFPLGLIIIPIYFISLYIAQVFAGFGLGLMIFEKIFKNAYKGSLVWPLILGLLIFVILGSIPLLGWVFKLLLIFWAIGSIIKIKQEIINDYR